MMTNVIESGRIKCHQYWEREEGKQATYGHLLVKTEKVEIKENWTTTSLRIRNLKVKSTKFVAKNLNLKLNVRRLKKLETCHIFTSPTGLITSRQHQRGLCSRLSRKFESSKSKCSKLWRKAGMEIQEVRQSSCIVALESEELVSLNDANKFESKIMKNSLQQERSSQLTFQLRVWRLKAKLIFAERLRSFEINELIQSKR